MARRIGDSTIHRVRWVVEFLNVDEFNYPQTALVVQARSKREAYDNAVRELELDPAIEYPHRSSRIT